jgi:D-arginine dehydrogenase
MPQHFDVIILGSGMAGMSLAAELAPHRSILVIETDDELGRHATGRSAALYAPSYGNPAVRALTAASRAFFDSPPAGFTEHPLLSRRGAMFVAGTEQMDRLRAMATEIPTLIPLDQEQALARVPILRPDRIAGALFDETADDIDVASMHLGYLRMARGSGAEILKGARSVQAHRREGTWRVSCAVGEYAATTIVNATGAWADEVARQAGVQPIGLRPLRRSAILIPAPAGHESTRWPMTIDTEETVYFKPDAGQLLLSPANEDFSEPCDAAPDELDVAIAVDRYESLTTDVVRRINHRWAGLRSFVADRSPVAGYDTSVDGFFWLAGQGGYGIQMAPALARAAAALLMRGPLPADISSRLVTGATLSPGRLR